MKGWTEKQTMQVTFLLVLSKVHPRSDEELGDKDPRDPHTTHRSRFSASLTV